MTTGTSISSKADAISSAVTKKTEMLFNDLLSSTRFVRLEYFLSIVVTVVGCISFYYVLLRLEKHNMNRDRYLGSQNDEIDFQNNNNNNKTTTTTDNDELGSDTYLEVEPNNFDDRKDYVDYANAASNSSNPKKKKQQQPESNGIISSLSLTNDNQQQRYRKLVPSQYILIGSQVGILTLLNYLLLVYVPGGYLWLSVIGIVCVWGLILYNTIIDEIRFHQRYDRIFILITIFLQISSGLCWMTYNHLAIDEGQIYAGPARIIAYDAKSYNNSDGITLRANLKVSWGGTWGCSEHPDQFCVADINGTLCETKYSIAAIQKQYVDNNEDYDQYTEKYTEEEEKYDDEEKTVETKGYTGRVNNSTTNEIDGIYYGGEDGEDVYIIKNGTTDEVDIAFKDTNQQISIQKNITSNKTDVHVDFTNTNITTTSGKEKDIDTTIMASNTTTKTGSNQKNKSSHTSTSSNSTSKTKNGNHERYQRNLHSNIDETITKSEENAKVIEDSETQKETMIDQKGTDEVQTYNEVVNEVVDLDETYADVQIEEDTDLEKLQAQNDALKNENEQLQSEYNALQKKEQAETETEEQIDNEIYSFQNTDDYDTYDNNYWNSYDWGSYWGSYECSDLFNYDLEGSTLSYNPQQPPEKDTSTGGQRWPTMNIYGNCKSCTAYIMDYYSTEHFATIVHYKTQAGQYFLLSLGTAALALFFYYRYKRIPRDENKLELLSIDDRSRHPSRRNHHHNSGVIA